METPRNVLFLSAFTICLALMLSPAVSYTVFQSGDMRCPEDWYKFADMCWTKIPESVAVSEVTAQSYCREMDAQLFVSDAVALCFNAGIQDDWGEDYRSDGRMFRKRVMGNNGM